MNDRDRTSTMPSPHNDASPGAHRPRSRPDAEERIDAHRHDRQCAQEQLRARRPRRGGRGRDRSTGRSWQRTAADFANYQRRTEQEREHEAGLANEALLRKVLAVADDFDRAIEHDARAD